MKEVILPFLSAVLLFSFLLLLSFRKVRYDIIYNVILIITASIPILLMIVESWIRQEKFNKTALITITIFLLFFVPTLFTLSIFNLIKKKSVHWIISAIGILLSTIFLGIAGMIAKISRVGIIG